MMQPKATLAHNDQFPSVKVKSRLTSATTQSIFTDLILWLKMEILVSLKPTCGPIPFLVAFLLLSKVEKVYTPLISVDLIQLTTIFWTTWVILTTTLPTFLLVCTRTMVVPPLISQKLTTTWIRVLNLILKISASSSCKLSHYYPQLSDTISLKTTVGIGYHSTTIVEAGASRPEDLLDNVEVYSLSPSFSDIDFIDALGLTYRISFQTYDNGDYSDREDLSHALSGGYDFTLFDSETPNLYLYSVYSVRNSNDNSFDYESVDAGIGLTLIARF